MCFQHEISILNQPEYKANSNWLQQLQQLIESEQNELRRPENRAVLDQWEAERDELRSVWDRAQSRGPGLAHSESCRLWAVEVSPSGEVSYRRPGMSDRDVKCSGVTR